MVRHRRSRGLVAAALTASLVCTGAAFSPGSPIGVATDRSFVSTGLPDDPPAPAGLTPQRRLSRPVDAAGVGLAAPADAARVAPSRSPTGEPATPLVLGPDPLLIAAGDVATCAGTADDETADLIDGIPGTVVVVGDAVYPDGTAAEFEACYDPTWGRQLQRTRAVPGNHEYHSPGADPYAAYFRGRGGAPGRPWYAFNVGTWRVYALDSDCQAIGGCGDGSPEARWLERDLAAHPRRCSIAFMHHPRFSSGTHGNTLAVLPLWRRLQAAGVDVVVSGHDHDYERFAPQTADGRRSARHGIREFVVGTGGAPLRGWGGVRPNSRVRNATTHGVLVLALGQTGYRWQFVGLPGATFSDAGRAACRR